MAEFAGAREEQYPSRPEWKVPKASEFSGHEAIIENIEIVEHGAAAHDYQLGRIRPGNSEINLA